MLISYFALLVILATGSLAVLNGRPATPHQFPYHVGIYQKFKDAPISKLQYRYGGAVISDKWVLTTGYVYFLMDYFTHIYVKAGKHFVNKDEDGEQVRLVVRYLLNPEHKLHTEKNPIAQNDLALLKVDTPFVFKEYVSAAGIPSSSDYFSFGTLVGWGSIGLDSFIPVFPKELRYNAQLPIVSAEDCTYGINVVATRTRSFSVEISNNQTCTGPMSNEFGACLNDDGSALVSQVDDKYVLIGIVASTRISCGYNGRPSVYTRVGAHSEWIQRVIESS